MYKVKTEKIEKLINIENIIEENSLEMFNFWDEEFKTELESKIALLINNPEKINLVLKKEFPYYNQIEDFLACYFLNDYNCEIYDKDLIDLLEAESINDNKNSKIDWDVIIKKTSNPLENKNHFLNELKNKAESNDFISLNNFIKITPLSFLEDTLFIEKYVKILESNNVQIPYHIIVHQNFLNFMVDTKNFLIFKSFINENYNKFKDFIMENKNQFISLLNYFYEQDELKSFNNKKTQFLSSENLLNFLNLLDIKNLNEINIKLLLLNRSFKNLKIFLNESDYRDELIANEIGKQIIKNLEEESNQLEDDLFLKITPYVKDLKILQELLENLSYHLENELMHQISEKINLKILEDNNELNESILITLIKYNNAIYKNLNSEQKSNKKILFAYLKKEFNLSKEIVNIDKNILKSLTYEDWNTVFKNNKNMLNHPYVKENLLNNVDFLGHNYAYWNIFKPSTEIKKEVYQNYEYCKKIIIEEGSFFQSSNLPVKYRNDIDLAVLCYKHLFSPGDKEKLLNFFKKEKDFLLKIISLNINEIKRIPDNFKTDKNFILDLLTLLDKEKKLYKLVDYDIIPKEILSSTKNFDKNYLNNLIVKTNIENNLIIKTIDKKNIKI